MVVLNKCSDIFIKPIEINSECERFYKDLLELSDQDSAVFKNGTE